MESELKDEADFKIIRNGENITFDITSENCGLQEEMEKIRIESDEILNQDTIGPLIDRANQRVVGGQILRLSSPLNSYK